jgi:hypothetical protein
MISRGNKWFSPSSQIPVSIDQNSRFAERLDNVWFKKAKGGMVRLGRLLHVLVARTDDLNKRVEKLEQAENVKQPSSSNRTANRTATGVDAVLTGTAVHTNRAVATFYGTRFMDAVGAEKVLYTAIDPEMEAAVVEAGRRLRFERKEKTREC